MRFKTLMIGGETYQFRFNHNVMAEIEERLGYGVGQMFQKDMGFAAARILTFYGLKAKHKAITIDRAGDLVGEYVAENKASGKKLRDLLEFLYDTMKHCGVIDESDAAKDVDDDENPPPPAPTEN